MATEFQLIRRFFAPLAGPEGADLLDDAAHYTPVIGKKLVLSKDLLMEGVHFPASIDPMDLGWRSLAVNISDLIAKGARPKGYLLGIGLPATVSQDWLQAFADGLLCAQKHFGCTLFGGDTIKSPDSLVISITVLGEAPTNAPLRSGASVGDYIYVSGTLGDAAYGFRSLKGEGAKNAHLEKAFLRPHPPLALIDSINEYGAASADISDGLLADLGHILKASGNLGARLESAAIPLSTDLLALGDRQAVLETAVTWGDDYQCLVTVKPENHQAFVAAAEMAAIQVTQIGLVTDTSTLDLVDQTGKIVAVEKTGYQHF